MARVILMLAPSRMLRLTLLAISPKGLLTYKRIVIRPLGLCLSIGLCTIAFFVGRMGIKRAFATAMQGKCGELVLLGLWLFIALLMAWTLVSLRRHNLWTGYDTLSSELGHARGHVSSACVGPQHRGACAGSSPTTSRDLCLFACGSTRFSSRVAPSRHGSKGVQNSFSSNRHLRHANPHDTLSASFTRVTKYWIPKYVLANWDPRLDPFHLLVCRYEDMVGEHELDGT
jgi:hypothetical protein